MLKRPLSVLLIVAFIASTLAPIPQAHAAVLGLPVPGAMVNLSPVYQPALIKGLTVHQDNPFLFDFILDTGNSTLQGEALKVEGDRLMKYFFACLTIPEKDLWVNLSPYEKDRMVPQALGETALGRDLLAQDYILKQLTASLIYPEKELGKNFWDRVYAKAQQMYGTTEVPVNTFNKVWIMADKATVYEHNQTAFVVDGHLKVMLEEDYNALKKNEVRSETKASNISSQIVREIILPEIEKEVNTGKNFAMLRQIFNSQILATWYKKNLKEALLNQVYADKSTVKGVNLTDTGDKQKIYEQYLQAYKKGVFNYIKDPDTTNVVSGETSQTPRKYFSGGYVTDPAMLHVTTDPAMGARAVRPLGEDYAIKVAINVNKPVVSKPIDRAMTVMVPDDFKPVELKMDIARHQEIGRVGEIGFGETPLVLGDSQTKEQLSALVRLASFSGKYKEVRLVLAANRSGLFGTAIALYNGSPQPVHIIKINGYNDFIDDYLTAMVVSKGISINEDPGFVTVVSNVISSIRGGSVGIFTIERKKSESNAQPQKEKKVLLKASFDLKQAERLSSGLSFFELKGLTAEDRQTFNKLFGLSEAGNERYVIIGDQQGPLVVGRLSEQDKSLQMAMQLDALAQGFRSGAPGIEVGDKGIAPKVLVFDFTPLVEIDVKGRLSMDLMTKFNRVMLYNPRFAKGVGLNFAQQEGSTYVMSVVTDMAMVGGEDGAMLAAALQELTPYQAVLGVHFTGMATLFAAILKSEYELRQGRKAQTIDEKIEYYTRFRKDVWHIVGALTTLSSGGVLGAMAGLNVDFAPWFAGLLGVTGSMIGGGIAGFEKFADELKQAALDAKTNGNGINDARLKALETFKGNPARRVFYNSQLPVFVALSYLATAKPTFTGIWPSETLHRFLEHLPSSYYLNYIIPDAVTVGLGVGVGIMLSKFLANKTPNVSTQDGAMNAQAVVILASSVLPVDYLTKVTDWLQSPKGNSVTLLAVAGAATVVAAFLAASQGDSVETIAQQIIKRMRDEGQQREIDGKKRPFIGYANDPNINLDPRFPPTIYGYEGEGVARRTFIALRDPADLKDAVDFLRGHSADAAMIKPEIRGGIDLDSTNMGMSITQDANDGVKVDFDPAMVERIRKDGVQSVVPVIIQITPVTADIIRPLLGLAPAKEEEERLAGV